MNELRSHALGGPYVEELAVVFWTSAKDSAGVSFFRLVNRALRADAAGDMLNCTVRFARTLKAHLVHRGDEARASAIQWPTAPASPAPAAFPRQLAPSKPGPMVCSAGKPGLLQGTATARLQRSAGHGGGFSEPRAGPSSVPSRRGRTAAPRSFSSSTRLSGGEREWLFPAYSGFEVTSAFNPEAAATVSAPLEIHIKASKDNK
ncbi:unnamed protein product [Effrenium voratum]|uniref:Uncharacterized protein n=1 Tax=Effrenium voratum TaxID=2562239 RepID=A0AA36IND9_9DINO|nr:unnamed protein product [Effrenium voratum]